MLPDTDRRASRSSRRCLAAATLTLVVAASACTAPSAPTVRVEGDAEGARADLAGWVSPIGAPDVPDRDGLQEALDEVADAFLEGDVQALLDRVHDAESPFGRRWQQRLAWMRSLPLAHYRLEVEPSIGDLASEQLKERLPGAQVVYVVEEFELDGFDPPGQPAREDLFLTVVREDGQWRIVGDTDGEVLGFVSTDHLWDLGPVTVTRRGDVGAIHRPDFDGVAQLLDEAQRALDIAADRWPLDFSHAVPIIVPDSEDELGELLHVSFDLSNFVAFATATSFGEGLVYDLTGSRIVVNPERFLQRSTATRELILVHELLHVATHEVAGLHVPNWLDEGIAQAVGEQRSSTGTALLTDTVTRGFDGTPPTDTEFRIGGQDRVFLSYQQAWSLVDFLARTYGVEAVADFYAAAGVGSVTRPGSEDHLLDQAARTAFGVPLAQLRAAWADDLAR